MKRRVLTTALISLVMLSQSAPATVSVPADWPYEAERAHAWSTLLTPMGGWLLANDRPTWYQPLKNKTAESIEADLRKAVETCESENAVSPIPTELTEVLCDLAAFFYRQKDYVQAVKSFSRAATIQKEAGHEQSAALIDILDCLALSYRGQHDFPSANETLKAALDLRKHVYGDQSSDTAAGYENLALCAYDAHDERAADAWQQRAAAIVGDRGYMCRSLSSSVVRPRPVRGHFPIKNYLEDVVADAKQIGESMQARAVARQQAEAARAEAERRRQQKWAADLERKRQEAAERLNRMHDPDFCSENTPGFATITGQALYPIVLDDDGVDFITTHYNAPKKKTVSANEDEKKPEKLPVEIALCKKTVRKAIAMKVVEYANDNNLRVEDFGQQWPSTRVVAEPLMKQIVKAVVDNRAPRKNWLQQASTSTGEFKIEDVPKGHFDLYVQVMCSGEYVYWVIPVEVIDKKIITIDILKDNVSRYVWLQNRQLHPTQG